MHIAAVMTFREASVANKSCARSGTETACVGTAWSEHREEDKHKFEGGAWHPKPKEKQCGRYPRESMEIPETDMRVTTIGDLISIK